MNCTQAGRHKCIGRRYCSQRTVALYKEQKPPKHDRPRRTMSKSSLETHIFLKLARNEAVNWHSSVNAMVEEIAAITLPRERGDWRDKMLMGLSLVLFCIIGAQMFSLYAHWYFHAGLHPILHR